MYFRKFPHPANFDFVRLLDAKGAGYAGTTRVRVTTTSYAGDVFRIRLQGPWPPNPSMAGLRPPPFRRKGGEYRLRVDSQAGIALETASGEVVLSGEPGAAIGLCGRASLFLFDRRETDRFYGMGEKLLGFELSGKQTKFWNTDAFADFHWREIFEDRPDPYYASIPYLIVHRAPHWLGLLLDNPHATFISTGADDRIGGGQMNLGQTARPAIAIGAENGASDLYILAAPSLAELTRRFQTLVGKTPRPPVWALGYHQCRWGYRSESDLHELDRKFRALGIPCDGLWIDIDYMRGFRVFTFDPAHFPNPAKAFARLEHHGRKVIPILDPGVKREPGYDVYEDGRKHDVFCRNPPGGEFVGLVWPGETVFPDFSLEEARRWWSDRVARFAQHGIRGAWIDMNDPSTGPVQNDAMLFQRGRLSHDTHHNQYALGMAIATRAGFEKAHPGKRPFVISRSGYTGIGKYAAIWTGDNCSNYHYLRLAIPCSINLALSGVPFNGPDIGGFAGNATGQLLRDWQKACFLFPFCRNHSAHDSRRQEPWAFDTLTLRVVRHYIRMRYKFRPYLYNLFIRHERDGDAILRPLLYDFASSPGCELDRLDDQFMVGPAVMQAPIVQEQLRSRDVVLPGAGAWWSVLDSGWIEAPAKRTAQPNEQQTPLYLREGTIIPLATGEPKDNAWRPLEIEAHVMVRNREGLSAKGEYEGDDGDTMDYRDGLFSAVEFYARVERGSLIIETRTPADRFGAVRIRWVLYDRFDRIWLNGKPLRPRAGSWICCGARQRIWRV